MGVRKLRIDYVLVKVVPAFLGRCDCTNVGTCGGLLAQILILLQALFVHFVYVTGGREFTRSCFTGFTVDPFLLPPTRSWDEYSLKDFLFPASGDDTHRLSSTTPSPGTFPLNHSFACCSECLAALSSQAQGLLGQWVRHLFLCF